MSEQGLIIPNPYIGPRAFTKREALYGREHELRQLFYLLTAERIVLLHSPSGAGKTSLIQAGLIPRLEAAGFQVLPIIRVGTTLPKQWVAPRNEPRANDQLLLASLLGVEAPEQPSNALNRYLLSTLLSLDEGLLPERPTHLNILARQSLELYLRIRPNATPPNGAEVLIFDQFEEILTSDPEDRAGKQAFFEALGNLLRDRRRWALFAMREEYVAALEPYLLPIPTRLNHTFRLDSLQVEAARAAIQEPARAQGVNFTDAAATRLIDDLRRTRVQRADGTPEIILGHTVEPVQLQVVCLRLWETKFRTVAAPEARTIVPNDIRASGSVDQALASYYEACVAMVAALDAPERTIRDWFEHALISPSGVRNQILRETDQTRGVANQMIARLIDTHLVRAEQRRGAVWYELSHDRLVEPIRAANATWRETNFSTLQRQAALWVESGRSEGLLLTGQALADAEAWVRQNDGLLTNDERRFLAMCRNARANARRERNLLIGLMIGLAAALVLAVVAFVQWQVALASQASAVASQASAVAEAGRANRSQALVARAATAESNARATAVAEAGRANTSQALAATAANAESNARKTVEVIATKERLARDALAAEEVRSLAEQATNIAAQATSTAAAMQAIVIAQDQKAALFRTSAQSLVNAREPDPQSIRDTLRQGLDLINSGKQDREMIDALQSILHLAEALPEVDQDITLQNTITGATWNASSDALLISSNDRLTIWSATSRQLLATPSLPASSTNAAWSSDGRMIASTDGSDIFLLNGPNDPNPRILRSLGWGQSLAWSPDDTLLTSAGPRGVRIWDVASGHSLHDSSPSANAHLTRSAWSSNNALFVIAGQFLQVRDRNGDLVQSSQTGQHVPLRNAAWSPEGNLILTVDIEGRVQIWDANTLKLVVAELPAGVPPANSAMWSRTGRFFVVAFTDGQLKVYETATRTEPIFLPAFRESAITATWSPDGLSIVAAGDDHQVRVFFFYAKEVLSRAEELERRLVS